MVALVTCISCSFGKCEECEVSRTRKGVMGGWRCVCKHDDQAQINARKMIESTIPFEGEGEFGFWVEVPETNTDTEFSKAIRLPGKQMRYIPK